MNTRRPAPIPPPSVFLPPVHELAGRGAAFAETLSLHARRGNRGETDRLKRRFHALIRGARANRIGIFCQTNPFTNHQHLIRLGVSLGDVLKLARAIYRPPFTPRAELAPWRAVRPGNHPSDHTTKTLDPSQRVPLLAPLPKFRAVAQLGSALEWGSRGRWFESSRPDSLKP